MQLVPGFDRRFDRSAAGGNLEVRPFDSHRDGPAAAIRLLTPGPNIVGHRDHARFDPSGINEILREGCLRPRGFSLTVGLNRTIVLAAGDLKVPIACFAEPLLQEGEGLTSQIRACLNAKRLHLGRRLWTHPVELCDRKRRHEGLSFVRQDRELAVWLAIVRCDLREKFVAEPCRKRRVPLAIRGLKTTYGNSKPIRKRGHRWLRSQRR